MCKKVTLQNSNQFLNSLKLNVTTCYFQRELLYKRRHIYCLAKVREDRLQMTELVVCSVILTLKSKFKTHKNDHVDMKTTAIIKRSSLFASR